ncbi:MAG: T9SS type A sorting domain-containing protein [bacterium]
MKKVVVLSSLMIVALILSPKISHSQWIQNETEETETTSADGFFKWFYGRRTFGLGYIPQDGWMNAVKKRDELRAKYFPVDGTPAKESSLAALTNASWTIVGPVNISNASNYHAGRVNTIVTDPTNEKIAYLGAAAGGIWKTTDAGLTWNPQTDNAYSLAMGALAIDPVNPNILYAGTGEFVGAIDSYFGSGLLKSIDGGKTWASKGLNFVSAFSKIVVSTNNSSIVYACGAGSGGGLYITDDGGNTWTRAAGGLPPGQVTDVTCTKVNGSDILYAAVTGHGIYLSQDGGKSWDNVNPFIGKNMRRMHIAVDPKNWKDIVALSVTFTGTLEALTRSTDGGGVWDDIENGIGNGGDIFTTSASAQGWYDVYVTRDPEDANRILVGGISIWLSVDGGSSWTDAGRAYAGGIHPDQHCAAFAKKGSNLLFVGCDGGVAISKDKGANYEVNQDNLAITQPYNIAIDQTVDDITYSGNQDNGTVSGGRSADWDVLASGDGAAVAVDSKDHNVLYFIRPSNFSVQKYNGSESTWSTGLNTADSVAWLIPLVQDETSHIIYTGSRYLYYHTATAGSWTRLPAQLDTTGYISAIGPAGDGKTLLVGTTTGKIWSTVNNGGVFTNRTNGLPGRDITSIKASPADKNTFYLTLSGFGSSHVMKTADLGATWQNISAALPDISANMIVVDDQHPTNLYVATDVGVFFSPDDGANWIPYGNGLPNSPVTDLAYHKKNRVIRAGTHGRSIWEAPMAASLSGITSPTSAKIWYVGEPAVISWIGVNSPAKVEISTDGAITWQTISPSVSGTSLQVPNVTFAPSEIALVRVTNGSDVIQSYQFRIRVRPAGSVLTTFSEQPFYMYDLAYDKDDNILWATSFTQSCSSTDDKKIYKIDPNTGALLGSVNTTTGGYCTGIKYDPATKHLFVHQSDQCKNTSWIYELTTTGTTVHKWGSPCTYGTGIFVSGDSLFLADRNNNIIHIVSKTNPLNSYGDLSLDRQSPFGPRCITLDPKTGNLLHTWTDFQGTDASPSLYDSYILRLNREDGAELNSWFVQDGINSGTNVRGIELDPRAAGTVVWVSVLSSGNSAKILKVQLSAPAPTPLLMSLVTPTSGSSNLDTSITFTWSPTTEAGSHYFFELSTDQSFATNVISRPDLTSTSVTIGSLQQKITYFWRVQAKTSDGSKSGPWTDVWSFGVKNYNSVHDFGSSEHFYIHNFPNPFSTKTTVEYGLTEDAQATLTLTDLLGRKIQVLHSGMNTAGEHSLNFDASDLTNGVYILTLESANQSTSHIIHVMK